MFHLISKGAGQSAAQSDKTDSVSPAERHQGQMAKLYIRSYTTAAVAAAVYWLRINTMYE